MRSLEDNELIAMGNFPDELIGLGKRRKRSTKKKAQSKTEKVGTKQRKLKGGSIWGDILNGISDVGHAIAPVASALAPIAVPLLSGLGSMTRVNDALKKNKRLFSNQVKKLLGRAKNAGEKKMIRDFQKKLVLKIKKNESAAYVEAIETLKQL